MKLEFAVGLFSLALMAVGLCLVLTYCTGCLSRSQKEAIADSAYAAEHMRCVDAHDTRAEIDACRAAVRVRWGIAVTVTAKDGGR